MLERVQSFSEGSVRFLVVLKLYFAVRPQRDALTAEAADKPGHKTLRTLTILCRYADHHHAPLRHRFDCAGPSGASDILKRMTRPERYG